METIGMLGRIKVTINVTVALVVILIGGTLIALYIAYPEKKEPLIFCAVVIAGMSAIYSAFHVGQSLRTQVLRDKLNRSFELTHQYAGIDSARIRHFIESNVNKNIAAGEVYTKIKEDKELNHAVMSALNWCEHISIVVQKSFADEEVSYLALAYAIPYLFFSLRPFIQEERKVCDDNLLYIEVEKLVNAWTSQTYLSTGDRIT